MEFFLWIVVCILFMISIYYIGISAYLTFQKISIFFIKKRLIEFLKKLDFVNNQINYILKEL